MTVMQLDTHGATPVSLSNRAMLCTLSIKQWSGRKLDKKVTAKVNAEAGAAQDAGRYNKSLIAKDALATIAQIVGKARADHVFISLPWMQDGSRIMPADAFSSYTARMQSHREAFEAAVAEFVANYDSYVSEARDRLGDMFDPAEYPAPHEVAGKFDWSINVFPLPDASDFRVDLGDAKTAAIRAQIETTMNAAMKDAMQDAWARLHKVVKAMSDKLRDFKPATAEHKASGVFRDSLVQNVRDLVEVLPMLNVAGDAALAAKIDEARAKLTTTDAKTLRDDPDARREVQQAAAQIADDLAAFMGA